MAYDHWKTTEPDWLQQDQPKDPSMTPDDGDPSTPTTLPTQAEVDAIHRELMDPHNHLPPSTADLHRRAAVMIARLERAWLEARSHKDETGN